MRGNGRDELNMINKACIIDYLAQVSVTEKNMGTIKRKKRERGVGR